MQGERAQMVFTDPPYNVPIDGHVGGAGAIKHREFVMGSGEMNAADSPTFCGRPFGISFIIASMDQSILSVWTGGI